MPNVILTDHTAFDTHEDVESMAVSYTHLDVYKRQVNALCMEKSVLHGFGQECGK